MKLIKAIIKIIVVIIAIVAVMTLAYKYFPKETEFSVNNAKEDIRFVRRGCQGLKEQLPKEEMEATAEKLKEELADAFKGSINLSSEKSSFDYSQIPEWKGDAWVEVNRNIPFFTESDVTKESYEEFSDFDSLGRTGTARACLGTGMMPAKEREEDLSEVKPTGLIQKTYPGIVEKDFLYNRCHLIAYCLTGHNAEEPRNFIAGTRFLNVEGMWRFEEMVQDYIYDHQMNHVLYRVTPVYVGEELSCRGVLMEAYSVEDDGILHYCVFCYNEQPGIVIDHTDGSSREE